MAADHSAGSEVPPDLDDFEANLEVSVDATDGDARIKVRGDLEFGTAATLRIAFVDAARQGYDRLVVDVAELDFIDSTGLSLLVQAKQRIESEGHTFVLRGPSERVRRVLEISGLTPLFTIE